jgi:hypothetical protein
MTACYTYSELSERDRPLHLIAQSLAGVSTYEHTYELKDRIRTGFTKTK